MFPNLLQRALAVVPEGPDVRLLQPAVQQAEVRQRQRQEADLGPAFREARFRGV
jgi:hypothetical protein